MLEFFLGLAITVPIAAPVSALLIGNTRLDVSPAESFRQLKNRRRQAMLDRALEWQNRKAGEERPYLWDDYLAGDADLALGKITYDDLRKLIRSEQRRYKKQFDRLANSNDTPVDDLISKWTTYNHLLENINLAEKRHLPISQEIADELRVQLLQNRKYLNAMFRTEDPISTNLYARKTQDASNFLTRLNADSDMRQRQDEASRLFVAPEDQFKALTEGRII